MPCKLRALNLIPPFSYKGFHSRPSKTLITHALAFLGRYLFAYNWKLPAYSRASLLTTVFGSMFFLQLELSLLTAGALLTIGALLLAMGKCI